MDNLDRKIKHILSQNISTKEYQNTVYSILSNLPTQKNNKTIRFSKLYHILAIASCFTILISGTVLGKKFFIKYFYNTNKGLDTAINHDYIDEPSKVTVESNETTIQLKNILMDDFNLSFSLLITIPTDIKVSSSKIDIPDMIITDDANRILYCANKESFDTFCQNNKLDYIYNEFSEDYINSGCNHYIKNKLSDNTIELVYNLYGDSYPKSKKINIYFENINIYKDESYEKLETSLNSTWSISYDLPEKFYNREAIVYSVKSCTNPDINITEACLYNTGMRFEFNTKFKEWFSENATQDEINKAYSDLESWRINEITKYNRGYYIYNEYIIDNNNNKYFPISELGSSYTGYLVNGDFNHMVTFDLTQYNANINNLKLHFTINLPCINEEIIVELERKS